MKKRLTLILMAFAAVALVVRAALSFTETSEVYAVPKAFTPTDGQVVQATPSVQLTYGVDGRWKESVSNGFDDKLKYSVVGNNNPKDGELAGDPPTNSGNGYTEAKKNLPISGTYYIFSPSKAGTITAGVKLGANKSIYVVDAADGTCLSSTIKVTDLEGNEQTLRAGDKANNINEYSLEAELKTAYVEFPVEAGKSYYLFCSGSKMAFWGFYFTPMSSSWNPSAGETLSAGTVLMDDDGMKATIPFASTVLAEQATFDGKSFDNAIQVRVTDLPSSTNPTGTEYTEKQSSSIVVEAKADIDLTLYYKRQPVNSSTYDENDSKDLKVYDQSSYNMLTGDFAIVGNDETGTYGYATKRVPLEKGKTYVIAAKGTTVSFYGFSYEVREYTDPSVSVLDLSSSSYEKTTVVLNRENVEKYGYLSCSETGSSYWNEGKKYGDYSGDFFKLNAGRWISLKAKGVSKLEVLVQSSTVSAEYTLTVDGINYQNRITHPGGGVVSSGEIVTNYDGEIEISLDGYSETVYPVAIILTKAPVPHAITTNVTPANVAAFTYNVDNATTQGTQAKAGETVKLTGVTLDGNYDEQDFLGLTITTASGKTVSWTNSGNAFLSGVPAFEFTMPDEPVTVTAQFKYDIECAAGVAGGTFSTNPTKAKAGEEVTITTTPDAGMKVESISVTGKTTNEAVVVADNKFIMPADGVVVNVAFVQDDTPEPPTVISWQLVEPADLVTGDIVVIVDTTTVTAMSNDQGTSNAPQPTAITLNAAKSALADQPADNLQWKAVVEDGSYAFAVGEDSLYCIASNNGVRVGHNNPNTKFTIAQDEDKNNFLLNTATNRYLGVYVNSGNPQSWRCYTSINANIKNTRTAFYKKVEGSIPVVEKYPVNVRVMPESAATITLNATEAAFGEVVELQSVALGEGYTDTSFKEISIMDASGAPVKWTNDGNKFEHGVPAFKFNMPEGGVVIALTFNEPKPEPVSDVYYQKINTNEELTDGEYLIVYEDADDNKAFNGALETLDAVNNYIDVTISDDNKIASSDVVDAATFTVNTTENSIKSASGLYIGQTSYANGLVASADAAIENNISFDGEGNAVITCTTEGGDVTLRFNAANNQQRFRYYKSGQQAVALYKKVDAAQESSDVVIEADEITEGDIALAIERKAGDKPYKKLVLNLSKESGPYTITKPIIGYESVTINGNGAAIDASQLTGPFIQMSETPTVEPVTKTDEGGVETIVAYPVDEITIDNVEIKGLAKQLFYANKQKYLIKKLSVENSIIGISGAAKKTIFDFAGGGNAEEIAVENSSLWADAKQEQAGGLLSSQTGQGAGDLGGTKQLLSIQNSTLYNISYGKNTNNQRRNNVAGMEYDIRNNVIVNCGKKGQFIKGLNGGSAMNSKNVKWTVEGNIFNFDGEDVSAAEQENAGENEYVAATGARSEGNSLTELANPIVKNSVAGVVEFEDAANGFFGGNVKFTSEAPSSIVVGDPRWTLTPVQEIPTGINGASLNDNVEMINDKAPAYNLAGQKVGKGYKGIIIKNGKKVVMK